MTVDYPDFTRMMQIVGSDIDVPISIDAITVTLDINITAADIMMPIDMQAAYIMMPIDIQGQVDDLNINIDIKAQTIGNLTIDINAQHVGIFLQPDWSVEQETDKNLSGLAECADATATFVIDYTVVATNAFIICQWGFNIIADCGAQASLWFRHNDTDTRLAMTGGRMGNSQSFSKPIAVVAGDHIKLSVFQVSGAAVYGYGCVGGYEI